MKVVYLAPDSSLAGGQRVIFQQAEELARRGLDVAIVAPSAPPDWFALRRARWEECDYSRSRALAEADVRVATFWTTVAAAVAGARGPVFHLCQGYEPDHTFYAPRRDEIRALYALPTHKLVVSRHLETRLREEGFAPVTRIGQTFDPADFPEAADRRFDAEVPVVLLVGSFEAEVKGVRESLEALSALRDSGVAFRLRRISATPRTAEEMAIGLADAHDVAMSTAEMSRAYREADVLVGPSHRDEGFGLPELEALASGLPALLSETPGHREVARDAAAYFPCGDAAALAAALRRLLADPDERRRLSAAGPREAARFRTEDVGERLVREFDRALRQTAPAC